MFSVIFEVHPKPSRLDAYFGHAKMLRPELEQVDGFVDNVRYRSLTRDGWILSLSGWRDEKSVVRWRTSMRHHLVQEKGRTEILSDYHLRVGQIVHDTHIPEGHVLDEQRLDETEVGEGTTVTLIDVPPSDRGQRMPAPDEYSRRLGLGPDVAGLIRWDLFDAVLAPGEPIVLVTWRTNMTPWRSRTRPPFRWRPGFDGFGSFGTTGCSIVARRHNIIRRCRAARRRMDERPRERRPTSPSRDHGSCDRDASRVGKETGNEQVIRKRTHAAIATASRRDAIDARDANACRGAYRHRSGNRRSAPRGRRRGRVEGRRYDSVVPLVQRRRDARFIRIPPRGWSFGPRLLSRVLVSLLQPRTPGARRRGRRDRVTRRESRRRLSADGGQQSPDAARSEARLPDSLGHRCRDHRRVRPRLDGSPVVAHDPAFRRRGRPALQRGRSLATADASHVRRGPERRDRLFVRSSGLSDAPGAGRTDPRARRPQAGLRDA